MESNYFVCTLGQAAELNEVNPHEYSTVNEFLALQGHALPDEPAVGFPIPKTGDGGNQDWEYEVLSR